MQQEEVMFNIPDGAKPLKDVDKWYCRIMLNPLTGNHP
jgi:hypothetical protein